MPLQPVTQLSPGDRLRGLRPLVGNTPLLAIEFAVGGGAPRRLFANAENPDAHFRTTGPEIWAQLQTEQLIPDAFVAGVGTGGTIMGTGRFLRAKCPSIRLNPVEPANSPTLSTGHKVGKHRIQGISDEFIPPIVRLEELDRVIDVDDGDAILMAQRLATELGLGVGISSGANFLAAMEVRSPHVRLLGFRAINRVCEACFDPADPASAPAGFFSTGRKSVAST